MRNNEYDNEMIGEMNVIMRYFNAKGYDIKPNQVHRVFDILVDVMENEQRFKLHPPVPPTRNIVDLF